MSSTKNRVLTINGIQLFGIEKIGVDKRLASQIDCDYVDSLKSMLKSKDSVKVKQAEDALIYLNASIEAVYRSDYRPIEALTGKKVPKSTKKTVNKARTNAKEDVMNARSNYRTFDYDLSVVPYNTEPYDDSPGFEIGEARVKLGKKIAEMRQTLNLSRRALSERSGVTEAKLFRMEHGLPIDNLVELLPRIISVIGEIKFT